MKLHLVKFSAIFFQISSLSLGKFDTQLYTYIHRVNYNYITSHGLKCFGKRVDENQIPCAY